MNTKEQVENWDKVLDEYEKGVGFSSYGQNKFDDMEFSNYFTMSRDQIEKLTPEDCAQISYRLAQFAFHVQRTVNRELARYNWSDETIKETIADELNSYHGYGYAEKSLQAIKHNSGAQSLNKIKKYAKQRADRLQYLSTNIKNLSDILLSVQKTKVKHGS